MKTELGNPLTKKQMKEIKGGKLPGCATLDENGNAYTNGCCTGLIQCTVNNLCQVPGTCPSCATC